MFADMNWMHKHTFHMVRSRWLLFKGNTGSGRTLAKRTPPRLLSVTPSSSLQLNCLILIDMPSSVFRTPGCDEVPVHSCLLAIDPPDWDAAFPPERERERAREEGEHGVLRGEGEGASDTGSTRNYTLHWVEDKHNCCRVFYWIIHTHTPSQKCIV